MIRVIEGFFFDDLRRGASNGSGGSRRRIDVRVRCFRHWADLHVGRREVIVEGRQMFGEDVRSTEMKKSRWFEWM